MKTLKALSLAVVAFAAMAVAGCDSDATRASQNLSTAADNFELNRRVVFYNGISGDYILSIEGLCSLNADNRFKIAITCKIGPNEYKKHFLGASDNVTYFIEQLDAAKASAYHYRVIFKPANIIPALEVK